MATYDRTKAGAELAGLQQELILAGLPVQYLTGDGDLVRVVTSRDLTDPELATLDAVVAAHDGAAARTAAARTVAEGLASSGDPARVLLRAVLRLIMASVAEERAYLAQVRQQVNALGGTLPPSPAVRTWDQLQDAVRQMIASGQGDAPSLPVG